jgi:hypothetical protein
LEGGGLVVDAALERLQSFDLLQAFLEEFHLEDGGIGGGASGEEGVGIAAGLSHLDEEVHGAWGDALDVWGAVAGFQFEEVEEAGRDFAEDLSGSVQVGITLAGGLAVGFRGRVQTIGVEISGEGQEVGFQGDEVESGLAGLFEEGEAIHGGGDGVQALKLSPQEQLVAALGFLTLNPPSCRASR